MTGGAPGSWTTEISGRERVRAVVETLVEPVSVQAIADQAQVSRTTAADELERMAADNWVSETLVDGKKGYDLNPSKLFFDELQQLIAEHNRGELEAELEEFQDEREALQNEFNTDSLSVFRERLADDNELSAGELREIRNVAATWESLNSDIDLVRHALRLYGDVDALSDTDPDRTPSSS